MLEFYQPAPIAEQQSLESVFHTLLRQQVHPAIVKLLGSLQDLDVLEAGCGTGWLAGQILAKRPASLVAIDNDTKNVESASVSLGSFADVRHLDLLNSGLQDASFDRIACSGVFDHFSVEEVKNALTEFKRLLRPKGRIVFSAMVDEDTRFAPGYKPGRLRSELYYVEVCNKVGLGHVHVEKVRIPMNVSQVMATSRGLPLYSLFKTGF